MKLLAIDPGDTESAYVILHTETGNLVDFGKVSNVAMLDVVYGASLYDEMVIEQIACMGMAVGAEVFETAFWSGRFAQRTPRHWHRIKRHEVKMYLCGTMRAKDANIRQAILDRYGGKVLAIGKKKTPGRLYGVSGDVWAALAVAMTFAGTKLAA